MATIYRLVFHCLFFGGILLGQDLPVISPFQMLDDPLQTNRFDWPEAGDSTWYGQVEASWTRLYEMAELQLYDIRTQHVLGRNHQLDARLAMIDLDIYAQLSGQVGYAYFFRPLQQSFGLVVNFERKDIKGYVLDYTSGIDLHGQLLIGKETEVAWRMQGIYHFGANGPKPFRLVTVLRQRLCRECNLKLGFEKERDFDSGFLIGADYAPFSFLQTGVSYLSLSRQWQVSIELQTGRWAFAFALEQHPYLGQSLRGGLRVWLTDRY
jgi:hypothetical protein